MARFALVSSFIEGSTAEWTWSVGGPVWLLHWNQAFDVHPPVEPTPTVDTDERNGSGWVGRPRSMCLDSFLGI